MSKQSEWEYLQELEYSRSLDEEPEEVDPECEGCRKNKQVFCSQCPVNGGDYGNQD